MQLPNVRRSRALSELSAADWSRVTDLITQIYTEAETLAELAATPEVGRRKELYARVASWKATSDVHDVSACAVCSRSLAGVLDPVTRRAVAEHLKEVSKEEQRLLSLTK